MLQSTESVTGSTVSDRVLVERLGGGDRAALDALFRRHGRTVFAYAYSKTGDRQDAEDLLQDTFVTVWQRRHSVSLVTESAVPWLLATTRFKTLNLRRARARGRAVDLIETDGATPHDSTAAAAELSLTVAAVDRAVAAMPELDRLVFALCVDGDQTYAEAARDLGISHAAVRGRLSRIRDEIDLLRGQ